MHVANTGSNTVSILGPTGDPLGVVKVQRMPEGAAAAPDDSSVYITNTGSDTVSVLDAESGKPVARFAAGKGPEGVAVTS